jgi:hypothetical protein
LFCPSSSTQKTTAIRYGPDTFRTAIAARGGFDAAYCVIVYVHVKRMFCLEKNFMHRSRTIDICAPRFGA